MRADPLSWLGFLAFVLAIALTIANWRFIYSMGVGCGLPNPVPATAWQDANAGNAFPATAKLSLFASVALPMVAAAIATRDRLGTVVAAIPAVILSLLGWVVAFWIAPC